MVDMRTTEPFLFRNTVGDNQIEKLWVRGSIILRASKVPFIRVLSNGADTAIVYHRCDTGMRPRTSFR